MPSTFTWTLTGDFHFSERIAGSVVRVVKRTLHGGVSEGVEIVEIDNGELSLIVLPTRGMSIWRGRCGDVNLKWNSPNFGPVHPNFVPIFDPGGLGFLEGFDEWLVRCGLESNGSPEFDKNGKLVHPLHGRIANLPARNLELSINEETGEIQLTGKVYETRLFFKKLQLETTLTTYAGSTRFNITDKVTNLSEQDSEFELLYHINTGQPFAHPGSRVLIPFNRMAPRTQTAADTLPKWFVLDPETPYSEEVVYFFEPAADKDGVCKTLLINRADTRALQIAFKPQQLPYFSFWKSRLSNHDGYVCGMEPSVNFPNTKSFEKRHNRVVPLKPHETKTIDLSFEILMNSNLITKAENEIQAISANSVIESTPRSDWSEP